jgi:arabinofuranosyltransferase
MQCCILIVATYSLYIAAIGGDYMAMYRFVVPILPFLYLLLGSATGSALREATPGRRRLVSACVVAALAGSLLHSTPLESRIVAAQEHMHGNHRGVVAERWYVARHTLQGEFFARYGKPEESIATAAIGAVGFYSGLRVYDVHGIVDPHIAHREEGDAEFGTGLPGHEKSDYRYIFARKPTFYLFNRRLFPKPFPGQPKLADEVDELVARDYRVRSVWIEDEVNDEAGYFAFLERRDRLE